ncbi:helix-turn-helix transcriptional regulator [Saccharopolyspora cebuensis]|uniref:Helix-turn-helix transcriptional regulator n=1 Tax=Saccharopolyspora cebuensis TaxID=418759 RepID=A0ABV4CVC4_9PSEU
MRRRELAEFLRHRRAAVLPGEVGLPASGRRRTPGLRREEVAWLAGVSVNYYERLEQARAPRPSPRVLDALGDVLRLAVEEREHAHRLAGHAPAPTAPPEAVPDGVRRLLDRLGPVAGYAINARGDVLAWNPLAAALLGDFAAVPTAERDVLGIAMRSDRCGASRGFAEQLAAQLREATARYPDDPVLRRRVELAARRDPAFAAAWSRHDVRYRTGLRKRVEHPDLGPVEVDCEILDAPGGLKLVLHSAAPGSSLDALAGTGSPDRGEWRP